MRHTNLNQPEREASVLATLRRLIPDRPLSFNEALWLAELQANRLLELSGSSDQPAGAELVSGLPRIRVEYRRLPISGLSYWNGREWVIGINRGEPETRQRFTLLHEFNTSSTMATPRSSTAATATALSTPPSTLPVAPSCPND
jgi:hypothetical protein